MANRTSSRIIVVGAGAAGLMAARELAAAGAKVTLLEARERLGGRIMALPEAEFGYPAEGGPEFIHGEAKLTHKLAGDAGLTLLSQRGERWDARNGSPVKAQFSFPHEQRLEEELAQLAYDMPIAAFLQSRFGEDKYKPLRDSVLRMVEGYDAADSNRISTFAVRDEWLQPDQPNARIAEGYSALIQHLADEGRKHSVDLRLNTEVKAVEIGAAVTLRCADGSTHEGDIVILTAPLPVLREIVFTPAIPDQLKAMDGIGFGDVVKFLYRFTTPWWTELQDGAMRNMSFVMSAETVPTWWTQHPRTEPVLTGWCAGPRVNRLPGRSLDELDALALSSLAQMFGRPVDALKRDVVAWRALHWGADPFARGAYSYATPDTRTAQAVLTEPVHDAVFFSGEALYGGVDMGTVEAALASGKETAERVLRSPRFRSN